MTTQPPHQPGFPQQQPGYPQQPPGYLQPPLPQKKRSKAKLGCLGCGGLLAAAIVIGGIAAVVGSGSGDSSSSAANSDASAHSSQATGSSRPTGSSKTGGSSKNPAPQQSTVDAFKAYVKKHESAKTREAAAHVTKIQGADKNNDILDTADIYTDYTGGLASADTGNAKLLASAFADFQSSRGKASKNGLVTVYDADGDILSNGKY
ncbi:hypothetical protein [Streptomyces canus]|uniref:hypothetical protein n=1 Tax=Streptomyces canus TaxID=58343 RepID=UPI002E353776|nr:hypothetical protein [Streptomyces canus]